MSGRGIVAALLCLLSALPGAAQETGPGEYEVKAAFLYNFALYVEWPASAAAGRGAIKIGQVGKDVFDGALEKTMRDRTAQGKPLEVVRYATADDVKPCHLLFVPYGERDRLEALARALKGSATLIVSEFEGAPHKGGVLNFYLEDKRVRIEVNPDAAARENLKIGAKVLRVSRIVKDGGK
ncbi:MAG TPA: YfiR family protein [Planctomycetota bacterium]